MNDHTCTACGRVIPPSEAQVCLGPHPAWMLRSSRIYGSTQGPDLALRCCVWCNGRLLVPHDSLERFCTPACEAAFERESRRPLVVRFVA